MEAINNLSSISDSESFDDSNKYEQRTRKHKRKHSKLKKSKDKRKYESDSELESTKVGKHRRLEVNEQSHCEETYTNISEEKRSRHRSRKHHRSKRAEHRGSVSSNSDDDTSLERNKRHRSRHKHSSRKRRHHKSSRDSGEDGRESRNKHRNRSNDGSHSSGDDKDNKFIPSPDTLNTNIREAESSKWDDRSSRAPPPPPPAAAALATVKSEPSSSESGSDTRPAARTSRTDHRAAHHRNSGQAAADHNGDREHWGINEVKDEPNPDPEEKLKPNLGLSGKLTEDANTYKGVVIKYSQPSEARKPKRRWRWYIFKGDEELPFLPLHRLSAYLIGRERRVVDVPTDHPSCSKQHAVLQYRLVRYKRDDDTTGRTVKPYIIDLESANGTYVNNRRITSRAYVELMEKDVVKFGYSSREYVLLHETSKDSDADTADAGLDMSPVTALMNAGGRG